MAGPPKSTPQKLAAAKTYYYSEKGKEARQRHKESGKRAEWVKAYNRSEKAALARSERERTPERKEWRARYNDTTSGKAVLARASKALHERRRALVAAEKLRRGCVDCGYNLHSAALDFDHVQGDKKFNVSGCMGRSLKALQEEIAKCVVRCANCHRVKTYEMRQHVNDNSILSDQQRTILSPAAIEAGLNDPDCA